MKRRLTGIFISLLFFINFLILKSFPASAFIFKPELKFRSEGTFKIVQFADIHGGPAADSRAINLMNNVLGYEKPDLVILTGDNTDGKCKSVVDIKKAFSIISEPMEARNIPWAIAFGNHDDEHGVMSKNEMMKLYIKYSHNLSKQGNRNIAGVGNYNLIVKGSKSLLPVFNIYILDSGKYAPKGMGNYDWIKSNQIDWYKKTSVSLKKKYGKTIPSLMFFHIPIREFKTLWESGNAIGQRNEDENAPIIDSGLFPSLLEMGDVKGVFVGHDHTNNYCGYLYGIMLGYAGNVGSGTYGKEGLPKSARVFLIKEDNPSSFHTWLRTEADFR